MFLLLPLLIHHCKWPVVHGDSIFYTGVQQLIQHKRKHITPGRAGIASCLCLLSTSVLHEQATQVSWALVREIRFYDADNVSLEGRVSPHVQWKPVYRILPGKNTARLTAWPWLTSRSLSWQHLFSLPFLFCMMLLRLYHRSSENTNPTHRCSTKAWRIISVGVEIRQCIRLYRFSPQILVCVLLRAGD